MFIEPVTIENGKINVIAYFCIQRFKNRHSWACTVAAAALVIPTGKFEFKIKEPFGVTLRILEVHCARHGPERTLQLMISDTVVITRIGFELVDRNDGCVIT
ncbi:MAG: hypothetical protein VYC70_06605 [Verrucomicrobiota bacterium]|nr:hypothetical protein [Verrucomicrobiota bacterium]